MKDLKGKVAIVTGAARGTGAAIARKLADYGTHVLLGDVLNEEGQAVAKSIGDLATYVGHDVTQAAEWDRIVQRALELHGRVDALVNNAAVLHMGTIERTPEDVLRRLLEVNTIGPYLGIRAVLDPMRRQGAGSIVNVTSIDALAGMNGISSYCASKWGLRGLTKAAALELGRGGVRVNCVCPAGGNPEMFGPWVARFREFEDQVEAYTADRGIPGEVPVEVIADAVAFLASDASRNCTGVDLPVDGGALAGRFLAGFNTL
jgi:3alpha(or 20beta)-hydroxysteroid dehydrogenase